MQERIGRPMLRASGNFLLLAAVFFFSGAVAQQTTGRTAGAGVIEHGRFRLHVFEAPDGEETYAIAREGQALVMASKFEYKDRGDKVSLSATLRMRPDLTPEQLELKGTQADISVTVDRGSARIRMDKRTSVATVPERFFAVAGYAPVSIHGMLLRYWFLHGGGNTVQTLPEGQVTIEHAGQDRIQVAGKESRLERYRMRGIIWGSEWLWVDARQQLVAVLTFSPGLNAVEAIRGGYESAMPAFLTIAAQDGIGDLARTMQRLQPIRKPIMAIIGGTLIDGRGGVPVSDSAVVIEQGRIVAAGRRADITVPKDAELVDATGKTVLPGLWDMHAHHDQVEWGPAYLAAGVTTVRDCGNLVEFKRALRDAIQASQAVGPRMLLAGLVDGTGPDAMGPIRVKTPEEARAVVARFKRDGFDQVKIYEFIPPALVPIITAEAHRLGMSVTGHVPRGMNALEAVEAGMDQINHFYFPVMAMASEEDKARAGRTAGQDPMLTFALIAGTIRADSAEAKRCIQAFRNHGTVIDPTLSGFEMAIHPNEEAIATFEPGIAKVSRELAFQINTTGLPAEKAEPFGKALRGILSALGAMEQAGVPIVGGTDGVVPGHSLHRELELYQKAGFTPMQAIQAATIVPARAMKLDEKLGTIERGKYADLIIVDGNPLKNIAEIRKVKTVVAQGRVYDCAELWRSVGFQP